MNRFYFKFNIISFNNSLFWLFLFINCNILSFNYCVVASSTTKSGKNTLESNSATNDPPWILSPTDPWIMKGGSGMLRLQPPQDMRPINNIMCSVTPPVGSPLTVNPATEEGKEFTVEEGSPDRVKIGKISSGGCYSLHSSVSSISDGRWTIATDNNIQISTRIRIVSLPSQHTTIEAFIGRSATIDCRLSTSVKLYYCEILNNTQQVVSNNCVYNINPVRKEYVGNWTCLMSLRGSMEEVRYTVSLKLKDEDRLESKVFTEGRKTHLQCTLKNSISKFEWCRAISPHGNTFLLSPGLVYERYSAVSTSVENKVCSLEIDSVSQSDYGVWRIELGSSPVVTTPTSTDDYTGCFIKLPHNLEFDAKSSLDTEPTHTVVKVGDNLRLECRVPWPSSYCYAIKPNGSPIKQTSSNGDRLLRVGVCVIVAEKITEQDAGRWTCGLASDDGSEDIHFYTDVEVMSGQLTSVQTGVQLVSGSSAVLMCKSPLHQPLKYCRFTNPQGKGFSLKPNIFTDSRFSYYGAGLDEGECGVHITDLQKEDVGTWICAATFISFSVEEFTTITIAKLEPSLEFKLGIGIGTAIFLTAIITAGTVGYCRRRARLSDEHQRILRQTPANSSENLPSHEVSNNNNNGSGEHRADIQDNERVVFGGRTMQRRFN